jgi:hypothetical protein
MKLENKLVLLDTTDMLDDGIRELEKLISHYHMEYKEVDLDVIQPLEERVCICIPKYDE